MWLWMRIPYPIWLARGGLFAARRIRIAVPNKLLPEGTDIRALLLRIARL
jgi:hypothetical protein